MSEITLSTTFVSVARNASGSTHRTVARLLAADSSVSHVYALFADLTDEQAKQIKTAVTAPTARVFVGSADSAIAADLDTNKRAASKTSVQYARRLRTNANNVLTSADAKRTVSAVGYIRDAGSKPVGIVCIAANA